MDETIRCKQSCDGTDVAKEHNELSGRGTTHYARKIKIMQFGGSFSLRQLSPQKLRNLIEVFQMKQML